MKQQWLAAITSILLITVFTTTVQCQVGNDTSMMVNNDTVAIDNAIAKFYQTLSFTTVNQNKYNSLPNLFTAQGMLISTAGDKPFFWTVQQYAQAAEENFKKQQMETWGEQETCSQTQVFGNIAQRFSTYRIVYIAGGKSIKRSGINAIQLIKEEGKWLITSVAWDRASDVQPIPQEHNCQ